MIAHTLDTKEEGDNNCMKPIYIFQHIDYIDVISMLFRCRFPVGVTKWQQSNRQPKINA